MFRQAQHANKKSTLNLPKGWEMKSLGDVCDILDSKRKPITKRNRIPGDIPYYGATGVLSYVKDYLFDEQLVLLGEDGAKWKSGDNSAFIINGKTWVNNHAHVLRPKRDILDDYWLLYNLNFQNLMPFISGMTVPKLNQGNMRKIQIPIPRLPEQKQIVDLLDNAFEVIERSRNNLEKNIANAKELFQSKLNEIFSRPALSEAEGWEEKTLGEVCEFYNGKAHEKDIDENGEYVVVNSKFISSDGNVKKYTKKQMFPLFENDIAMVMSDVPNGKALAKCYIIDEIEKYSLNQRICAIRSDEYFVKFLYYNLNRNKFLLSFNNGENQTNLRKGDILKCPLFLPPKEKQKEIARHIDKLVENIRLVESHYHQKLANLEDLKKSLLQKAFSGALTSTSSVTARQAQSPLDKLSHRSTSSVTAKNTTVQKAL